MNIEGIYVPAFEARTTLANYSSICDDKYDCLRSLILKGIIKNDNKNYVIGDKIQLKNEFYEYANNLLIIHEDKKCTKFILIMKRRVFLVTENPDAVEIKTFFSTHKFSVIDSYGKELLLHNYEEFCEFTDAVEQARKSFRLRLEKYHEYMEKLFEFRKVRSEAYDCNISEEFDKFLSLADEYSKEFCDLLYEYHDRQEQQIVNKFIHRPSLEESACVIFGLYISVLKEYAQTQSDCERNRKAFYHEFGLFLSNNENIFTKYTKYFSLDIEKAKEIEKLLEDMQLDVRGWFN